MPVGEVDIVGLGAWSDTFADWGALTAGLRSGEWRSGCALQPERIAPRERRRAPQPVRMAVEVMDQACAMASMAPETVATVFSSSMGDMQITDYMCTVLANVPGELSPTRFHNSVHNAATGYWSIATRSHAPANAVSAHQYTAPIAFLEAAIQAVEEEVPVLLVTQEMAAPLALRDACPTDRDFAAALLLAPAGCAAERIASLQFEVRRKPADWPDVPEGLKNGFSGHTGARLLPLLAAIASPGAGAAPVHLAFPLSAQSSLALALTHGRR